jgi:hypothetical protein
MESLPKSCCSCWYTSIVVVLSCVLSTVPVSSVDTSLFFDYWLLLTSVLSSYIFPLSISHVKCPIPSSETTDTNFWEADLLCSTSYSPSVSCPTITGIFLYSCIRHSSTWLFCYCKYVSDLPSHSNLLRKTVSNGKLFRSHNDSQREVQWPPPVDSIKMS